MLYIFDPTENLIAMLKPDFNKSTGPTTTSRAFLSANFPAEFDREPTEGCPYWDAIHREVLNGENTFTFTVPGDRTDTAYIQEGNLVAFRDLDSYWQVFEIKRLVDIHGDGLTRTAYCEHIFYELLDDIVVDKRPSAGATAALAGMLENTRWQVGIVDNLGAASTNAYYESALSGVQKVAEAWAGELKWRCVIAGGVITRYVDLLAMRGTDTGKQFAYSKDILSIEREVDSSNIATALYGRGKGVETESGEGYGRRLTFAEIEAADKPLGQEWIGDNAALAQWGRGGRHRFDVFTDEEETDPAALLEKTRAELAKRKVPRVTYRLDVVSLEELTGYEHEAVRLGDLVRVIDREFKPELVVSARVIDIERDILDPANTKVVLGSFAPTIIEATINTARRVETMANRPYNTKWLDGVINVLQNAIENTQAYVFETPQGTLHLNAPTYAEATEAMLLGGGRYAIANQKDGLGGWNWRTFGDGSGFTADLITTGKLDAGLVQIGHETTFEQGYDPVDNHVYFQYSVNGTTGWHDTFNSTLDKYMRQKVGDNGTWSAAARIVGQDGQDGTSSYLWVRYSQNANGNPMTTDPTGAKYIGVATTTTASAPSSYASYSWSLIKGTDGIKGENGDDGQTSYLHIKYSDDGVNFTANNGEDVGAWIGTYVDFIQEDSTIFNDYTWNKVRGEDGKTPVKGADYFDGVDGQDGISSYLWIKYSADADGTNFSDTPNTYMGVAVTTTPTAPTLKTAYRWTKVVGTDGIPGEAGADGQTSYLHIKYSDDGTTFTGNGGEDVGAYIGTYIDFNQADSTNFGDYTWNKIKGEDGQDVRKFTSQPMPPYDVGDLWIGGSDGKNTLICINARATGSFVASDWGQITETVPAVGMGADDNCTGLWHFDGSLNSHKGLPAIFDGAFVNSKWGQGLSVVANKTLKIPTAGVIDPEESSVNMLAYNLASSPNGSVIFDLGDSDGNQAIKCGIANDGKLFIEDNKVECVKAETSQADFNTGTLTDVVSNPTGDLTLGKEGTDFAATEDTQAEFEAGTLVNTEYVSGLKLEYTPGVVTYDTDFTGGATYTASGQASLLPASNAFDNALNTMWISDNNFTLATPVWIAVQTSATKKARKLRIKIRPDTGLDYVAAIKDFILQGSNDGTNWTDIYTGVGADTRNWQEFTFENEDTYNHHRIYAPSIYNIPGTSTRIGIAEIEIMEATSSEPGTYALSGTWEKEYNLAAVDIASASTITWSATTPANTSIQVQAAIALDGVNYGSYQTCIKDGAIPGITAGMDLSSAKMKIKATLTTTDDNVTPSLDTLALSVTSTYKTSGNRVHIYDISGVGIAELSEISWNATLPTGTSLVVKAAISTDGGSSYGAFQTCTNGQAIPVLTEDMDISNARLKIQEDLATSDYSVTPKLNSLDISVSKAANLVYGLNKSELTGWDNIAIQWKTDRLSLIINGVESAYIENPGQVTTLAEYAYIGSDKAGANQIGTVVDELRIDKIYQEVAKVNAWHIVDAPFYTSEEFAQWPGYIRTETDGLKVYDSEGNLRVLLGSWMEDLLREYGLEIIGGRIYASLIKSGGKDAVNYIQFAPPNKLEVYGTNNEGVGYKMMEIVTELNPGSTGGSGISFYKYSDLSGYAGGLGREGNNIVLVSVYDDLLLSSVHVMGDITKTGSYSAVEPTDDYGTRLLYAAETPELLYYDRGVINLVNGEAKVYLDPIFLQCIEPDTELTPWQVWVQCYGENEVHVVEVGEDYFKVKERNAGTSNNKVVWRLEATRKNYAGIRLMEVIK